LSSIGRPQNCRIQLLVVIFHKLKQSDDDDDDDAVHKVIKLCSHRLIAHKMQTIKLTQHGTSTNLMTSYAE